MLGVNRGHVELTDHSDDWKELFAIEKAHLNEIVGEHVVDIQHFGSTSISNIQAKPIIDMLVGVKYMDDIGLFDLKRLREMDIYRLKVVLERKVVFAKFSNMENGTKTHVIHVVEYGGDWWKQHIFFRDYLNENPKAAADYEKLKRELAVRYQNDERAYTDRKKAFVDSILKKNC